MTAHFDSLVRIVTDIDSFDVSNEAAVGLLKGTRRLLCLLTFVVSPALFIS